VGGFAVSPNWERGRMFHRLWIQGAFKILGAA